MELREVGQRFVILRGPALRRPRRFSPEVMPAFSWFSAALPLTVLERLLEIERVAGRVRGRRNEPRVLDLDLLLLGDLQVHDSRLVVPHPRMWTRRFVLAPLEELAPDLRNPATLMTVRETLQDRDERPWARLAAPVSGPV